MASIVECVFDIIVDIIVDIIIVDINIINIVDIGFVVDILNIVIWNAILSSIIVSWKHEARRIVITDGRTYYWNEPDGRTFCENEPDGRTLAGTNRTVAHITGTNRTVAHWLERTGRSHIGWNEPDGRTLAGTNRTVTQSAANLCHHNPILSSAPCYVNLWRHLLTYLLRWRATGLRVHA
jgi:hypothetical protein